MVPELALDPEVMFTQLVATITKKLQTRALQDLKLGFEASRLEDLTDDDESETGSEEEDEDSDGEPLVIRTESANQGTQRKKAELLANIFDAADEDDAHVLTHLEVAQLLGATLRQFGLQEWDIYLLMATAHEDEYGLIAYHPFVQAAPEMIDTLAARRAMYTSRWQAKAITQPEYEKWLVDGKVPAVEFEQ